jgi:hypothetical protein
LSSLDYLAIALGVIVFAFVIFVLLPKALLLGLRDSLEKRVQHRYPDPSELVSVEYRVSSFGVKARGLGQWRGNGALAITRDELRFFQFLPQRELTLKLSRVTGLSIVSSHLGKATTSDLLKIEFATEREPGAIAFWLPDPQALKAKLEALTDVGRRR